MLAFPNIHIGNVSLDRRSQGDDRLWGHYGSTADAQRQRAKDEQQDCRRDTAQDRTLPLSLTAQKGLFLLYQWFEQADKRHFAVQQRVANRDRGLSREDLDHFEVG